MPRQTATIDTSCLIALNHLQLLDKISILFDAVYVPKAVQEEISRRGGPRRRIRSVLRRIALYQKCAAGDPTRVALLLIERKKVNIKPKKDLGEAEAIVQATEIAASMVIMDDALGRSLADRHSLENHGVIWILRQLRRFGAITELRPYIRRLRSIAYRLPPEHVRELLLEFQEEPE